MIELRLTVDNIDYDELFSVIIPHLVKNKLAERPIRSAISAKFASMSESEKDAAAAGFLNDNASKITEIINEYVSSQLSGCRVSSLKAANK